MATKSNKDGGRFALMYLLLRGFNGYDFSWRFTCEFGRTLLVGSMFFLLKG